MARSFSYLLLPAACIASAPALAIQYLTTAQAQKLMFSEATQWVAQTVTLTAAQKSAISKASGVRVRSNEAQAWRAYAGDKLLGWFIVDEVIGKHEFITYALGITPQGAVRGLEIMDYRETHGGQVVRPDWRRQFTGKTRASPLKLDEDIQNISGATLSCVNVTKGVKRLLATWELALNAS